jgi:hypothetical protein
LHLVYCPNLLYAGLVRKGSKLRGDIEKLCTHCLK